MAIMASNMGVFGNSIKNVAIRLRNYVDLFILPQMRVKIVRWHIFLGIFENFRSKRKKMVATTQKWSKSLESVFGGSKLI